MVVKEVAKKRAILDDGNASHYWNSEWLWAGPAALRYPQEAKVHRVLNTEPSAAIVGYRSDVVYLKKEAFRIYLDFCPCGDAYDFSRRYGFEEHYKKEEHRLMVRNRRRKNLPEPFLWYFLLRLTEACIALKSVTERAGEGEAIHRDIKLTNIYLDEPGEEWPNYPTPRLGDFGLTFFTSEHDDSNPEGYTNWGTAGWKAPEQFSIFCDAKRKYAREDEIPVKLDARTNIWAVGTAVWTLAVGCSDPPVMDEHLLGVLTRYSALQAYQKLYPCDNWSYSQDLLDQVRECMNFDRTKRPWPDDLRRQIRNHMRAKRLFPSQWPVHLWSTYKNLGGIEESEWRIGRQLLIRKDMDVLRWLNEGPRSRPAQGAAEQAAAERNVPVDKGKKRVRDDDGDRQPPKPSVKRPRRENVDPIPYDGRKFLETGAVAGAADSGPSRLKPARPDRRHHPH